MSEVKQTFRWKVTVNGGPHTESLELGDALELKLDHLEGDGLHVKPPEKAIEGTSFDKDALKMDVVTFGPLELESFEVLDSKGNFVGMTESKAFTALKPEGLEEGAKPEGFLTFESLPFPWVFWVLLSLLLSAVSIMLVALFKWYRKRQPIPEGPKRNPWEEALHQLGLLKGSESFKGKDWKEVCVRLSSILRAFIGSVFQVDALEATTSELRQVVRQQHLPLALLEASSPLFELLDLVKYAKVWPEEDEALRLLQQVESWMKDIWALKGQTHVS